MKLLAILCALFQAATGASPSSPLERIPSKTVVEDLSSLEAVRIAGVFKNPGKSLIKKIGGTLSGDILYLFPDGTYIYIKWSDVSPEAISDKGVWTHSHGLVELVSDAEVKWKPGIDRHLIVLRRGSVRDEVLLFELDQLPNFEKNAGGDPESMLLIIAKERLKRVKTSEAPKLKAALIKSFWDPKVHDHS